MSGDDRADHLRTQAQNLLRSGKIGGPSVVASGQVGTPIAVRGPEGQTHSWFVPVTIGKQLAAFFQFMPDGTFMRFSSFQRRENDLTGCPEAADWLDLDRIQKRAEVQCRPDETIGRPFLTYDRSPDRLVWAVPLTNARGEVRLVYVVGQTVYAPPAEETYN